MLLKQFLKDESGAVTVDWVVLTSALMGLGIAASLTVIPGVEDLSGDIAGELTDSPGLMRTSFGLTIANGSFEDIEGMIASGWGFYAYNDVMAGWDEVRDLRFEVVHDGYAGVPATDGAFSLDMDASPGNMRIGQNLTQAVDGQTYTVSFTAADPSSGNGVDVYFGGEIVGQANPDSKTPGTYSFEIVGGAGDGDNRLELQGTGREDNVGAYIDNIAVF